MRNRKVLVDADAILGAGRILCEEWPPPDGVMWVKCGKIPRWQQCSSRVDRHMNHYIFCEKWPDYWLIGWERFDAAGSAVVSMAMGDTIPEAIANFRRNMMQNLAQMGLLGCVEVEE